MHKHASANRFYRLVWSHVHACWVVVAESARGRGKSNSSVRAARRLGLLLAGAALAGSALAGAPPAPNALPGGAQLVAGQASIATSGNQMTVTQSSSQAIVNWQRFDIGADAAVRFNQPSASAVALNRVVGNDPSQIYGKLSSNGSVFLINPQGVLFGASAQVDVGALTASSLNIADKAFLDGQYDFSGSSSAGAVSNAGRITAASGGYVALIAPSVSNSGSISAPQGSVALAAGEQVSVDLRGDGLIGVRTTRGALQALAQNSGAISADGGQVLLSAAAADALTRATVNNSGIVQARGIVADGGSIRLVADDVYAGTLDVSSTSAKGGSIAVQGQYVSVDGAIQADGASGGSIAVSASGNLSAAATVSASGHGGAGGAISYAAGNTLVENTSSITRADGGTDGGSTTLSAGASLDSSGAHSARGGSGIGGRIDVSGQAVSLFSSTLDASGGSQGGLVRVGGAFQGGTPRADAPDADRFLTRWGQTAAIASASKVFINDSTNIDVSARGAAGQGGTAIVWSQDQTTMLGALKATGAAAGGTVEISSADELRYVNLDQLALGHGSSLLLDPKNILISDNASQWTYTALTGAVSDGTVEAGDGAGFAVALSANGTQMAVGAPFDSGATVDSNPANPSFSSGAVRLYTFDSSGKFSGAALKGIIGNGYTGGGNYNLALAADAQFGAAVALSGDGKRLAVGAPGEWGGSGAVHEFTFGASAFSSPTVAANLGSHYGTNVGSGAIGFGSAVALNGNGGLLAAGALYENTNAGKVYLFNNTDLGQIAIRSTYSGAANSLFGTAVALNDAGDRLAVGAINENNGSGKVYLYNANSTLLMATLSSAASSSSNTQVSLLSGEYFGSALAFNAAGTRLAVGAPNAPEAGGTTLGPGAVRIFDFTDTNYGSGKLTSTVGRGYTFAPDGVTTSQSYDNFGFAVALNGAGDQLVVGSPYANLAQGALAPGVSAFTIQSGGNAVADLGYAAAGASGGTTVIKASSLAGLLDNGSVTLQASNDLTLDSGSSIFSSGSGTLSLSAGRSVVLNSNMIMQGTLTVLANASKPTASTGPVDKDRDPGTAVLTVNGSISAGNVSLTLDQAGSFKTNTASGAITVAGMVGATGKISVQNLGTGNGNDVVLGNAGRLASGAASGDGIVVVTKGSGRFVNNNTNTSTFGNGLSTSGSARYLVYSSDPGLTTENMEAASYNKHYGQAYTGTTPGYAASGNWFLYSVTPTLTVDASSSTKVYDGQVGGGSYTASGFIDGDTAATALSGALGLTNGSRNVGVYDLTRGSLASSMGYNVVFNANSAKLSVTPATLNVSVTSADKVYDGNASASVSYSSNAIAGDALSLSGSASFADKNVASGKTVSVDHIVLGGADAGNYVLSGTTASTTAAITPRTLTVSATGSGKVYDGLADASAALGDNRVNGDVLSVSSSGASYADKNVGVNKAITVKGLALSGTDAGNYTLASDTASTSATITQRSLSVSATGSSKVYDGQTSASVTLGDNRVSGDSLNLSGNANYTDKNAQTGKTVNVDHIALSGADAGNYTLAATTASTTGDITPRTLNASATGDNKVYDGSTAATVQWHDDRVSGDVFAYSGSIAYADKNAGSGKDITISNLSLNGVASGNYVLASTTLHSSADITARALAVNATGSNKVYDGLATAAVTLGDNRVAGDQLTLSSSGASYSDKNAGSNKTITVKDLALNGADAGNYTLAATSATAHGDISARALTISATGADKVYDGSTAATVNYSDNRVAGDSLGYTASAAFDNKNAGANKGITVDNIVLTGADKGNYTLGSSSTTTSANITQRTLTVTANGVTKVYDGLASGSATLSDDRISGDLLTVSASGSAAYADKNAGTGKTITVDGVALGGADVNNYVLASTTASGTGTISPKTVNVSVSGSDKVYDGSAAAAVSYSENDRIAGDVFTISGNAAFGDKNAGTGKTISVDGMTLGGADRANYVLASDHASTTASITPRALTATISSAGKVYDGTVDATVTYGDNRVAGDVLSYSGGNAAYADKNAGAGKTIGVNGITLDGADKGNYTLTNTSATTTADITPRALVVTGTGVSKVYDGTTAADVTFTDNRLAGDQLTVSVGSASYVDKNVGANKALTISGATLSGADAGNYTVDLSSNSGTGAITARALTVSATGVDKVYDGTTAATVSYTDNRVAGDVLSYSGSAEYGNKNAGSNKAISVNDLALGGADSGNYVLSTTSATTQANITPRALVVTATGASKVYDGSTAASATLSDDRISGDVLAVTGGAAAFADKNAGTGKALTVSGIQLSGGDAGNYTLAATTANGSGDITPRDLTFAATGANKVYDGTAAASLNFSDDRLAGDRFTYAPVANFSDKNVGTAKTVTMTGVTLSGTDAGNYHLTSTTATATASISPRTLNVSAAGGDKVYDGTTAAVVTMRDDRIAGDTLTVNGGASFASKNAGVQQLILDGVSLSGGDARNYTLSLGSAGTATITPRALAASVTAADKVYDGSNAASIVLSTTALAGDSVQVSGSGVFADKNVGAGKTVTVSGVQLSGADAGNYTLSTSGLQASASITPRALVTSITASDKVYDGTVAAQFAVADNRVAGDALEISGGSASFNDKNAGSGKTVTVSGLSLGGADARNYTLASSSATTTASIAQKALVITANNQTRTAGGANPALSYSVNGLVAGDSVGPIAANTSANPQSAAGTYTINLAGASMPNYKVTYVSGVLTVISAASPVSDAITSIVKPELPAAPSSTSGGAFSAPATPVTPQQLVALAAANAGRSGGADSGSSGGNGAAFNSTGNGGSNANGAGQDEVTTSSLPGGTQIAARNGGIRTAE